MNRRQIGNWMVAAALIILACSPVLSTPVVATLNPDQMNTAIANTAAAAVAATSGVEQGLQPAFPQPAGPTLDPLAFQTALVATSNAAASRTAAFIPPSHTPSITPFPTWTASPVPSITPTWIFKLPTPTRTSRPIPTRTPRQGGGGGGGGHGGGEDKLYSCAFVAVSPASGSSIGRNQPFATTWVVVNTGDTWLITSVDLVYRSGERFRAVDRLDLRETVAPDQLVNLPPVAMRSPDTAGTYSTTWSLQVGHTYFCSLFLTLEVR